MRFVRTRAGAAAVVLGFVTLVGSGLAACTPSVAETPSAQVRPTPQSAGAHAGSPAEQSASKPAHSAGSAKPASTKPAATKPASNKPAARDSHANMSLTVDGRARAYDVITPTQPAQQRLPVVVVLHGISATVSSEEIRTGLLPEVDAGNLILAYPYGYDRSWNAGNCCGKAQAAGVDDIAFLTAVFLQLKTRDDVDPRQISVAGYSNGGRMAYDLACKRPDLMSALIVIAAVPDTVCPAGAPVPLLQIASDDDPEVAYASSDPHMLSGSFEDPSVSAEVATWRARNGCESAFSSTAQGNLKTQTWFACSQGMPVELATYSGIEHLWPYGGTNTPPAAAVMKEFLADVAGAQATASATTSG